MIRVQNDAANDVIRNNKVRDLLLLAAWKEGQALSSFKVRLGNIPLVLIFTLDRRSQGGPGTPAVTMFY